MAWLPAQVRGNATLQSSSIWTGHSYDLENGLHMYTPIWILAHTLLSFFLLFCDRGSEELNLCVNSENYCVCFRAWIIAGVNLKLLTHTPCHYTMYYGISVVDLGHTIHSSFSANTRTQSSPNTPPFSVNPPPKAHAILSRNLSSPTPPSRPQRTTQTPPRPAQDQWQYAAFVMAR